MRSTMHPPASDWDVMGPDSEKTFREFVAARGTALFRAAYVLTGNQHQAEDLVQSALAKTAARWDSLQKKDDPEGYVRRAMYHERISWWRRRVARYSSRTRCSSVVSAFSSRPTRLSAADSLAFSVGPFTSCSACPRCRSRTAAARWTCGSW